MSINSRKLFTIGQKREYAKLMVEDGYSNKEIKKICKNNTFDIYKLHSDFSNGFTSMAAYIINHKSIEHLLNIHN